MTDFANLICRGRFLTASGTATLVLLGCAFATPAKAQSNGSGNIVNSLSDDPNAPPDNPTVVDGTKILPQFQFSNQGVMKAITDVLQKSNTTHQDPTLEDVRKAFAADGVSNAFPMFKIYNAEAKGIAMTLLDYIKLEKNTNPGKLDDYAFSMELKRISYASPALHLNEMGKVLFAPGNSRADKCMMLSAIYDSWATYEQAKDVFGHIGGGWGLNNLNHADITVDQMEKNAQKRIDNPTPWALVFLGSALTTTAKFDNGTPKTLQLNDLKFGASIGYSQDNYFSSADPMTTCKLFVSKNSDPETKTLVTTVFSAAPVHQANNTSRNTGLALNGH